jgi:hypothetical protein
MVIKLKEVIVTISPSLVGYTDGLGTSSSCYMYCEILSCLNQVISCRLTGHKKLINTPTEEDLKPVSHGASLLAANIGG